MRCQEKGLSLEQFIKVMLVNIKKSRDRPGLVKNLIELFRQIDVNNDQTLEWEEFTDHIIQLGKYLFRAIILFGQLWNSNDRKNILTYV